MFLDAKLHLQLALSVRLYQVLYNSRVLTRMAFFGEKLAEKRGFTDAFFGHFEPERDTAENSIYNISNK